MIVIEDDNDEFLGTVNLVIMTDIYRPISL